MHLDKKKEYDCELNAMDDCAVMNLLVNSCCLVGAEYGSS